MMHAGEFDELTAFAAIAEERSFYRAAARLNLRPSTLSHALRSLEERLRVRLIAPTVAATPAGEALLAEIAPAVRAFDGAVEAVNAYRARPQGIVRITVPQGAPTSVLTPRLGIFVRAYADVTLDISVGAGMTAVREHRPERSRGCGAELLAIYPPPADPRGLSIQIPEEIADAQVPGPILQPLVENAVNHGGTQTIRPVAILISGKA